MSQAPDWGADGMPVVDLIQRLRESVGAPVNVVERRDSAGVRWTTADAETRQRALEARDVEALLDLLVARSSGYTWRAVEQHTVVYPVDEPAWLERLEHDNPIAGPRLDAASEFVETVTRHVPALGDLAAPPMRGDPDAPIFMDPVSPRSGASILEQLVQLLGDDDRLAFTVERGPSGHRVLHFQHVMVRQPR
jgi:hypothetical protein